MKKLKNLGKKLKNVWVKFVKEPILRTYQKNKEKRELNKKLINIRKDFENRFNVKVKHVKELMYPKGVIPTNDSFERQVFLNQELEKARKLLSDPRNVNKHVFFYEPEMVDIHNESTHLLTKDLNEIKKLDYENAKTVLNNARIKFNTEKELKKIDKERKTEIIALTPPTSSEIYDDDYGRVTERPFKNDYFYKDNK